MTSSKKNSSRPIEDYGLIGNMISAALVSREGSIDWLCLPRFDSGACFASLLGGPSHGRWLIAPRDRGCRVSRRYLPGTAVLETCFETDTGKVMLTDFMPLTDDEEKVDVVRIVKGIEGKVEMAMDYLNQNEMAKQEQLLSRLQSKMSHLRDELMHLAV